jgi:beta-glucanase (GH16 family)
MSTRSRMAVAAAIGLLSPLLVVTAGASSGAPTAQSGVTVLSAPFVQPGRGVAASSKAKLAGSVRFQPARKGRPVKIQRRVGDGSWTTVSRTRQDGAGTVRFVGAAYTASDAAFEYRGVAVRWGGLRAFAAAPQSADVWTPAFVDEFTGTALSEQWRDRASTSPTRRCAKVGDPRASKVALGSLRLRVMVNPDRRGDTCRIRRGPDKGRYRHYLNGQVSTQHLTEGGAFTRGTFAARIKFPKSRGQHGAFWMQPTVAQHGAGPKAAGAEIDVVEFFGKGYAEGGLASFLYNYGVLDRAGNPVKIGGLAPKATTMLPRRDTWWTRYHVFSMEWTPSAYIFRVDGREHFRTKRGVTAVDEYLILSLLTSNWELKQAKKLGIEPGGTMYVDWARVWQK